MHRTITVGLLALCAGAVTPSTPALAQQPAADLRVVPQEENFRAAPGGTRVAVLLRGTPLVGGEARERWREATLEGWVRAGAVTPTTRDGFDLAIASGGATLHRGPDGEVIARGLAGFLLDELERRNGWVRVRRTGWVWSPSLERVAASPAAAASGPRPPAAGTPSGPGTVGARSPAGDSAAAPTGPRTLHRGPSGPVLGTLESAVPVEVIGREGEWARVRVEGWVRVAPGAEVNADAPISNLSLRELRENPDVYRGRAVAWRVQYISVQRADSLRTDLTPGEAYILARDPGGEPGFVYIAVSPPLLPLARRLVPLQQVEIVARVRNGRSALMGHPVLDLLELRS